MRSAHRGTCFMSYISWPIILLIGKYSDNLYVSIAQQQLILMRSLDEGVLTVLHMYLCQNCGESILCTVSFFIPNTLFVCFSLPLFRVNISRCLTGSATTKNCSCRVTRRSAWATNMPLIYRRSTITLPWIPWWVEDTLCAVSLCAWMRKGPVGEATSSVGSAVVPREVNLRRSDLAVTAPFFWEANCCLVHPDIDIWLFPQLKSSTTL